VFPESVVVDGSELGGFFIARRAGQLYLFVGKAVMINSQRRAPGQRRSLQAISFLPLSFSHLPVTILFLAYLSLFRVPAVEADCLKTRTGMVYCGDILEVNQAYYRIRTEEGIKTVDQKTVVEKSGDSLTSIRR